MYKTKIIFFTGGVYSSIGKGICVSSVGRILKELGFKVSVLKLDPYLNINSGLLSPSQHGEVYVTADGEETDLDLGHYERFLNTEITKKSCITAGKIYANLLNKEYSGINNGFTVQVVPHVIAAIHSVIFNLLDTEKDADFLLIEIGGTVGDMESTPFLAAARHMIPILPPNHTCFIHIVPLLFLKNTTEHKTKPAQHSISQLMNNGIIPDFLVVKSDTEVSEELKTKIAINSGIDLKNIIVSIFQTSIYNVPNALFNEKIHEKILNFFGMPEPKNQQLLEWKTFTDKIVKPKKHYLNMVLVGKYANSSDAYISVLEAFKFASYEVDAELKITILSSDELHSEEQLKPFDLICVPQGFGKRGAEGKMFAIKYARENKIPFFGICFGMQLACIEFARNVLNLHDATTTEFETATENPVIFKNSEKIRLGKHEIKISEGTKIHEVYKSQTIFARHRHKYAFNQEFLNKYKDTDFVFSATSDNGSIIEAVEIKNHPFFVAVQFHPEFDTWPTQICPLFTKSLQAAIDRKMNIK